MCLSKSAFSLTVEHIFEAGAREAGVGDVYIVDGAKAGVEVLSGMVRMYGKTGKTTNGTKNGHA